ncbi:MAG TPA: FlgD immunoglobulin-like domain containing protein [Candidatus Methylacidiphilales bacterium]|nr:FlgD immunoglobulin-like domain containing protein [Candidatus Methylacidiphilales bacterium]
MKQSTRLALSLAGALSCLSLGFGFSVPSALAAPNELTVISNVTTPRVAYDLEKEGNNLKLILEVASFDDGAPAGKGLAVDVGVVADKEVRLKAKDAKISGSKGVTRYTFTIPGAAVVTSADGWKKLRLAFAVEWAGATGKPDAPARLKQAFLHVRPRAAHAGLSLAAADWQPVDLAEMERLEADRALEIGFDFVQPLDGKATIVIDDADGIRVRNLVTAQVFPKGTHRIAWDGLDEKGNTALPGSYKWRAISHPGLVPKHQMDFVNAPGSNHGTLEAAVTNGSSIFFAATVAEGGHEIVEFTMDGTFKRGHNPPNGHGLKGVALAADDQYLYAAHEGTAWGDKIDKNKKDWKGTNSLTVMRINLATWNLEEFTDSADPKAPKIRFATLAGYEFGPGSASGKADIKVLGGLACVGGRLFLGDVVAGVVRVLDPRTAKEERTFPLPGVMSLVAQGDALYAIAENKLVKVDTTSGKTTAIATLEGKPGGFTVATDGRFYVSDQQDNIVRVLDGKGKQVSTIGKPGGIAPGPYDPLKMQNPAALALANGQLWVTERNRWTPKRLSSYDVKTGAVGKEFFGPTNYGAQGAGFDDKDETKWIGQGTMFTLDYATKTAKPTSITGGEGGRRHTWWRQDGRTFLITSGKATYIQELLPNGTLKPLAMLSATHQYSYSENWNPPAAFLEAFARDFPDEKLKYIEGTTKLQRGQPSKHSGMLWVDKNGDGAMETSEIEFAVAAEGLGGSGWSHDFHDLTLRVLATVDGKNVLVALKPDGFYPTGAPKYPSFNDTVKAGIALKGVPGIGSETAVDRFGNLLVSGTPDLCAVTPEGKKLWTYPNDYRGVHGSHNAPLPSVGEMQGALFFSGVVPLDEKSDVFLINGNHGQAFVLTSDGMYVDAMFPDCRMMTNPQGGGIGILGGECFGGTFGKSEKDGNYYFQGGGIAYRVYKIDGLRELRRTDGSLKLSAPQAAAAERKKTRLEAEKAQLQVATIPALESGSKIIIDGKDGDWKALQPVAKWNRGNKFPVNIRAAHDSENLYLFYTVKDASPWVNNGKDWQSLFKTGDGVDLQIATDLSANPRRAAAAPGDIRLFVAPSAAGDVAVLYRHRVPGARDTEGVVFQSPWRSEKVDVVRKLDNVKIAVTKATEEYRVEFSVPLAELGLKDKLDKKLKGDFGVIYGDGEGTINVFRNYWNNTATGLVNDVPGEIMLNPNLWGEVTLKSPGSAADADDKDDESATKPKPKAK